MDLDAGNLMITAANLGNERPPSWYLNLRANPEVTIELAGERRRAWARIAEGEEGSALWSEWLERIPAAETFAQIAGRPIPIIVLEPATSAAHGSPPRI